MSTRPIIFDDAEHAAALKRVDALMDAKPGTPDGDELDRLVTQIREYEDRPHGSTRCPICGSWDVHQHDAQAVLKHRQRAIHKAATSTEIDLLREDRDYFKAAYSRKLDDERKALEVGLAVLEEHERAIDVAPDFDSDMDGPLRNREVELARKIADAMPVDPLMMLADPWRWRALLANALADYRREVGTAAEREATAAQCAANEALAAKRAAESALREIATPKPSVDMADPEEDQLRDALHEISILRHIARAALAPACPEGEGEGGA